MHTPISAALSAAALLACATPALHAQDFPAACADHVVSFAARPALATPEYRLELAAQGGGRLLYFGAEHASDPAHPQFAAIESAWGGLRPTVVFYEGPARGEAGTAEETIRRFGESGFVRFLGRRGGARIERLEPDPRAEAAHVLERFPAEQVKLFYLLRETARLRDRRGMAEPELRAAAEQMIARMAELFPEIAGEVRSTAELETAYRRYWTEPADWWMAPSEWFDPGRTSAETGGVFTNEVNRASSEFRDRHMFEAVAREVLRGERVLAVVGRDHVAAQSPALRCAIR